MTATRTRTAASPTLAEVDYPSRHRCAKCGTVWVGSAASFATLTGFGDGKAHVIHHDCPNPDGRDWWAEPAVIRPGRRRAIPKWQRPPADVDRAEVLAAAQLIYDAALRNRVNFTAAVWRIQMDKAGVAPPVRRRAVAHAIRAGWIEVLDPPADPGTELTMHDLRETRWKSLIYTPKRPLKGAHSKAGRPRP